jgi:prepilin signal peptidase PulO-like enzyme (type II secretory pathway)
MSIIFIYFFTVILSLIIGSFLTVATEDPEGLEWLKKKRSRCPKCNHVLGVMDLIPVFSFLMQRGRCRYCSKTIPKHHIYTEIAAVCLGIVAIVFSTKPLGYDFVFNFIFLEILFALTLTDIKFQTLPDVFVLALGAVGIVKVFFLGYPLLTNAIIGAVLGVVILGSFAFFSKGRAMGWGDVKLAGAMGLVLGIGQVFFATLLAFVLGGIIGAVLMISKKATAKSKIAFGPFLTISTALLLLFPGIYYQVLAFYGLV